MKKFPTLFLLLVLAAFLAVPLFAGCASSSPAVLNCIEDKLKAQSGDLAQKVLQLVESGGADWESKVLALAESAGVDIFGCALQAAHAGASPPAKAKISMLATKKGFIYQGLHAGAVK